jgi:hypothetical protein
MRKTAAKQRKTRTGARGAAKMRKHRDDMRRRGFKLIQFWAPDPNAPGFKAAVRATRTFLEEHPDHEWDAFVVEQLDKAPEWNPK